MAILGRVLDALLAVSAYTRPPSSTMEIDDESVEDIRKSLGGNLQPPPTTQVRWYMSDLESAQYLADVGDLSKASRLCNAMRRDGTVSGVLSSITSGLVRLPKRFRGAPEIVSELERGHDSIRSVFDEMVPPTELETLAADFKLLKVAVGELLPVEGRDYPVLCRLNPEYLRYRWNEGRWYFMSNAGPLPITPGDGRWVLFTGPRLSPWQYGKWHAVGRTYIIKEQAVFSKANYESKLANPARVGELPAGATDADAQTFIQRVAQWGLNTVFALRPGWKLSLLESNGRGFESFAKTIEWCDHEIMIDLAGQIMTTTGGEGFANSATGLKIQADILQELAEELAFTVNTQILPQFIVRRWGIDALSSPAVMAWDTATAKDQLARANALLTAANAVKGLYEALALAGLVPEAAELCTEFGIPIKGDVNGDSRPDDGSVPPSGGEHMGIDFATIAQALEIAQRGGLQPSQKSLRRVLATVGIDLEPSPAKAESKIELSPADVAKAIHVDEARERVLGLPPVGGDEGAQVLGLVGSQAPDQGDGEGAGPDELEDPDEGTEDEFADASPEASDDASKPSDAEPTEDVGVRSAGPVVPRRGEVVPARAGMAAAGKWDESKHPRKGGKFAPKGVGDDGGKKDEKKPAKKTAAKKPAKKTATKKPAKKVAAKKPARKAAAPKRKTAKRAAKKTAAKKAPKSDEAKAKAAEERKRKAEERKKAAEEKRQQAAEKRKKTAEEKARKVEEQRKKHEDARLGITKPEHHAEHWEEHYKHLGAAAKPAAWGHAIRERGLDMHPSDVVAHMRHLTHGDGVNPQLKAELESFERTVEYERRKKRNHKSVRDMIEGRASVGFARESHIEAISALAAQTRAMSGKNMEPAYSVDKSLPEHHEAAIRKATVFYSTFASKDHTFRDVHFEIVPGFERAHYDALGDWSPKGTANSINASATPRGATIEHELGHCLEHENPWVHRAAQAFLKARTDGETPSRMNDLEKSSAYRDDEVARPDKFLSAYMGKDYGGRASEIMSMGVEELASRPTVLHMHDPEMFHFVLGVLAGHGKEAPASSKPRKRRT